MPKRIINFEKSQAQEWLDYATKLQEDKATLPTPQTALIAAGVHALLSISERLERIAIQLEKGTTNVRHYGA